VNDGSDLVSPCVGVCVLDADSGLCQGCLRDAGEIAAWSGLDFAAKLALLDRLRERRAAAGWPTRRPTRRRNRKRMKEGREVP